MVIAASFFWMSNPMVFVREFEDSLAMTTKALAVGIVLDAAMVTPAARALAVAAFLLLCVLSQLWTVDDAATDATRWSSTCR